MNEITIAVVSVSVIGVLLAAMLSVASKVMAVEVDERFPLLREILPGANCGACGFAGCDGYAQALVDDPTLKTNLCPPGGATVIEQLSAALGVAVEAAVPKVATVKCNGTCVNTTDKMEYAGEKTCVAAKIFYGGKGSCSHGCIGFGDCAKVCPYDAIYFKDGIACIDEQYCIGCAICATVCPSKVIEITPTASKVYVSCNSKDKGATARKNCKVACIACKKCEKACTAGAIVVENNLAKIDYELCTSCGACVEGCPSKCILIKA